MKKLLRSLFVLLFIASSAMAQDRTITGTVTSSEDGLPIPGVSVKAVGSTASSTTGNDGRYSIGITASTTEIQFSYIGFTTETVAITSSNTVNIRLSSSSESLGDVVVVAYGTQKKESITGSVSSITSKDLEKRTVTNITSALQGSAPGINVAASNGQPGVNSEIRIRGFGSISSSSSPLIVLDGAVYDGSIGDINQNDVESISVLKDASSSALYGSRGGNGVVIITTKRGKATSPVINVSFSQGWSTRGIPEYELLNAYEYFPAVWQGIKNNLMYSASTPLSEAAAAAKASNDVATSLVYNPFNVPAKELVDANGQLNPNASLLYNDFDWYAPLKRTGQRTDANVSASGKTEKSDYLISLGYLNDKGFILKSDFRRFNARVNVNTQLKPWLRTGLNLSGSMSDANIASDASTGSNNSFINAFSFARNMGPIYPVHAFDATGNPIYNNVTEAQWYDYGIHPDAVNRPSGASPGRNVVYETILNDNLYRRSLVSARSFVEVRFLKDFTFTPAISMDLRNNNADRYRNPLVGDGAGSNGYKFQSNNTIKSYTFNQILNYKKTIGLHNITALLGHENYSYSYRTFEADRTNIVAQGNTALANFVSSTGSTGRKDDDAIESYFSKASYNYDEKYFFDASFRRDGSSRFSSIKRWGPFFSVGGSWSMNKEDFLKDASWIDDLRLKVSYGQVGNNALLDDDDNARYYGDRAFFDLGSNNNNEGGVLLSSVATPELTWEKQNTLNTGVSFSFFGRRLTGEVEFYRKNVNDLILSVPQPLSSAVTSVYRNVGAMYNQGVELQLGGDLIRNTNFNWNLITNWTIFKNKITELPAETPTIVKGTKRREAGHSFYDYYLRQFAGVDPNDGSSLYIPADGTAAANIRTVNGVQYVTNQSFAKYDYSGSAVPDLLGSVNNTFSYKNVSLSFLINYQIGGKAYDAVYAGLFSTSSYGSSLHKDVLNAWTQTNKGSNIPRLDYGNSTNINAASSRWLIDASYVALRNVNLSYNLPKAWLSKIDVSSARLFVTGENLYLKSRRKGLNPTESFDGVNQNTYPQSRAISVGINLSL
ncbi:SusC/RagA family TonB-linked outer membrane protein [Pedobacter endophyticus]|uniref:TonB-dependent receptor n=1 Tax=Pedobacter endophyticus TaxID=2789740 RepID=A0A7U3Q3K3_9SPHI|nr:TonB-dependent receptor [Pedobacter endophyticus]QPH37914.1 TonB-dependent receptor [Pedobacter endophyticus]